MSDETNLDESDETEPVTDDAAEDDAPVAERAYTQAELTAAVDAAAAESKDRVLRISAEYENFRRRVQKEREQWGAEAIEKFVSDLVGVLDDFDRALLANAGADDPVSQGIRITEKQLRAALARHGVEAVDPLGAKFDPKFHEAIQRAPASEKSPAGTVVAVYEKGYMLKGKLLRPARVQVAGDS